MPDEAPAPGFPREEFGALLKRMPSYARLAWALAGDPRLSRVRRAAVLAAAAYVVSPIDLVPGIIPVVGQLDDLMIGLAAIRFALDGLRPQVRAQRMAAAGISQADLDADLRTTRAIAAWLGRSGLRVGRQLVSAAAGAGASAGRQVLEVGRDFQRRTRRDT